MSRDHRITFPIKFPTKGLDMDIVAERIGFVVDNYPEIREEVVNLGRKIYDTPRAAQFTNRKEYTNFCLSEVLGLHYQQIIPPRENNKLVIPSVLLNDYIRTAEAEPLFTALREHVDRGGQDPYLLTCLGRMYSRGYGVTEDSDRAGEILRLAIEKGSVAALLAEARRLEIKSVSDKAHEKEIIAKSFSLYHQAADLGTADAQFSTSYLYHHGIGVERNHSEAIRYARLSSEQGLAMSTENLSILIDKNSPEGKILRKLAAEQGGYHANRDLGDYTRAILELMRGDVSFTLSDKSGSKYIYSISGDKNTPLTKDEIIEIIFEGRDNEGLKESKLTLIADIVRVSMDPSDRNPSGLTTSDLAEIYCVYRDLVLDLDFSKSASGKMMASYIAKSMGEKIIAADAVSITLESRKKKVSSGLEMRLLDEVDEVVEHATVSNNGKQKVISVDALRSRPLVVMRSFDEHLYRPAATTATRAGTGAGVAVSAGLADFSRK